VFLEIRRDDNFRRSGAKLSPRRNGKNQQKQESDQEGH